MANRLFKTEAPADVIISEKTKNKSATVAEVCNNAIYFGYLPNFSTVLNNEARYILQEENITQEEIRKSLSRGVTWLGDYCIKNSDVLHIIMSHFSSSIFDNQDLREDNRSDAVVGLMRDAYFRLKDLCPGEYIYETINATALVEQILDNWSKVYHEKLMYRMISCAIHIDANTREFSKGEAIEILKAIENQVIIEHISQDKPKVEEKQAFKCIEKLSWLFDKSKHGLQIENINLSSSTVNVELSNGEKSFKIDGFYSLLDLLDRICDNIKRRDV